MRIILDSTYDSGIENSPSSQGRVRRAIINTYDELGQLVRVNDPNDPTGGGNGTTWLYTYDRGGNMKERIAYQYSTAEQPPSFVRMWINSYDDPNWKDKLTDSNGITVDYDANGNPTEYWGWNYTWEKGRQLKKAHYIYGDPVTLEFKYNKSGLRTQKVKKVRDVITETTDYVMSNKTMISMKKGNDTLYFSYDMSGSAPVMVTYNGARYTYVKNLLGDIVALADASGSIVCEYKYDAWGKPLSVTGTMAQTIGALNPFRYRGYIWDEDMENYYLRSRYYNPSLCRFLQADSHLTINAFAYANNNPVMNMDEDGTEVQRNGTTTIVVYLHVRKENGKIKGAHFSLSIGNLYFSMGNTEEYPEGVFTFSSIEQFVEMNGDLPKTRITIYDVPIDYALGAIIRMLEICFPLNQTIYLTNFETMEDIEYHSLINFAGVHKSIREGFTYDYEKRPCIHQIYVALTENARILLDNLIGYFKGQPGERKSVKGTSDYMTADRMIKYRIIRFEENAEFYWEEVNY